MAKKVSLCGLALALSMIFGYLEHLFALDFIAPGVKLGLANCVFLVLLSLIGFKAAAFVNISRIFLCAFLFSNPISLIFSLSGGILSMGIALLLSRFRLLNAAGIGAICGVAHNLAQLVAAWLVIGSAGVFLYSPILMISGIVCGTATGAIASAIEKHMGNMLRSE